MGSPHSSVVKESACNSGDSGSIPGSGKCPGEGNGNPLQYSCLENPVDRGAWQAIVHRVESVRQDLETKKTEGGINYLITSLSLPSVAISLNSKILRWLDNIFSYSLIHRPLE